MAETESKLLSVAEYARCRGCSVTAVRKAVRQRRISVQADGRIDPAKADKEWQANTRPRVGGIRPAATTAGSTPVDYQQARARRELAEAQLAELKLAEQRGELVRVVAVRERWQRILSDCRQRLLAIPSRVATQVAGATPAEAHAVVQGAIYEALEELSRE